MTTNAVNWFEIPVADLDRAVPLYEAALGTPLHRETFLGVPHAIFASAKSGAAGGALIADAKRKPGATGSLVYLAVRGDVQQALDRAVAAGAVMVVPVTSLGPNGSFVVIRDLDGNHVGLHAPAAAS